MGEVLPLPRNPSRRRVVADVQKHGLHIIHVAAEAGGGWSYSIGLFHTHRHSELVIVGLPSSTAQVLLNALGARVKAGERFSSGVRDGQVLTRYPVQFVTVPESAYRDHFGFANWFYRGAAFPVLQVVWPDRSGAFPWDPSFDPSLVAVERVLGNAS